jgi:hypothetical protein
MDEGLPAIVLAAVTALTVMAFWRQILMVFAAAFLTVFAVGLFQTLTWLGDVL